jgi:hypothetical protein
MTAFIYFIDTTLVIAQTSHNDNMMPAAKFTVSDADIADVHA